MKRMLLVVFMTGVMLSACNTLGGSGPGPEPEAAMLESPPSNPQSSGSYEAPQVPEPGLQLSPDQRFKDIPLPVGLKDDPDRTYVFESATLQVGRMVYTSRASVEELAQFFIRECPTAQWKLQNVLEAEGKTLLYTKPGKTLQISVQNLGMAKGRRVTITLTPTGEESSS